MTDRSEKASAVDQRVARTIISKMMAADAFSQWMGIEIIETGPGKVVLEMKVRPEMVNGFGVCHGGVTFSFADSALAFAAKIHLH